MCCPRTPTTGTLESGVVLGVKGVFEVVLNGGYLQVTFLFQRMFFLYKPEVNFV